MMTQKKTVYDENKNHNFSQNIVKMYLIIEYKIHRSKMHFSFVTKIRKMLLFTKKKH